MRFLLLTGNQRRHRWAAQALARRVSMAGIVAEAKHELGSVDGLLADHFRQRDLAEESLLGEPGTFPGVPLLEIPNGSLNEPRTMEWMERAQADLILLYGTGVVRAAMLERFGSRMINLHLGLSPWYRGAGTNFWPFVYNEPECVGATIHRVAAKVDAGEILCQVRPQWRASDGMHEAGTKALMAGVAAIPDVIAALEEGRAGGMLQDLSLGRVFRQSDFGVDAVREARENLLQGSVGEYVAQRELRDARFPLVTLGQGWERPAGGGSSAVLASRI